MLQTEAKAYHKFTFLLAIISVCSLLAVCGPQILPSLKGERQQDAAPRAKHRERVKEEALPALQMSIAPLFRDRMVLQRQAVNTIWGKATPGLRLTLNFQGQTYTTITPRTGIWRMSFTPRQEGGPYDMTLQGGGRQLVVKDVMVGELWLCGGQSNVLVVVLKDRDVSQTIKAAVGVTAIRIFRVKEKIAHQPQEATTVEGQWKPVTPQSVGYMSAFCYRYARHLYEKLKVPIGMLRTSWTGKPAEGWIPRTKLEQVPEVKKLLDRWDFTLKLHTKEKTKAHNKKIRDAWLKKAAEAKAVGKPTPPEPTYRPNFHDSPSRPGRMFNAMIHPLRTIPLRGVLWYQGESNYPRSYQFRFLLQALIKSWRELWQRELPFFFVQLTPFRYTHRLKSAGADIRESQFAVMKKVKGTGMVVTSDICNTEDVHDNDKQEITRRLALWAFAKVYGQDDIVHSGPVYRSMQVVGSTIALSFDHVAGGLKPRLGTGPLTHFTIAGQDQVFHPATATIVGDTVVVSSPKVKRPVAVRHAWTDDANPNLVNSAGLPTSIFRTDNWPLPTKDIH